MNQNNTTTNFCQVLILSNTIAELSNYISNNSLEEIDTNILKKDISEGFEAIIKILKRESKNSSLLNQIISKLKNNAFENTMILKLLDSIDSILEDILINKLAPSILSSENLSPDNAIFMLAFLDRCSKKIDSLRPLLMLKLSFSIQRSNPAESFISINNAFELQPNLEKNFNGDKNYIFDKKHEQFYFENCPVCQSEDGEPYFNAFSYSMINFSAPFLPAKLWVKCNNCNNLYTYAFPKQYLNSSDKIELIKPEIGKENEISEHTDYLYIWSEILNKISNHTSGKNILEVGIGNGEFIAVALEMGYNIESIEIVKDVCQKIANLLNVEINCCDFLKFETDKKYSIITMGDVIEHVTNPTEALNKVYNMLEDDGILWISTPNYESSFSRLRKFTDAMWNEPTHITYFNYTTFAQLLSNCGFEILEYLTSNRWNGSMELMVRKRKHT